MTAFKDHFSSHAAGYAAHRPSYPDGLVDVLADLCPATDLALDCGCGTGQLSVLLARRFARVVATDASAQQIANAEPHPRVDYRVAPADRSGLPDASADLIVAAQAAHWFDLPAFYDEARRVGRPRAILALVTYGVLHGDAAIDPVLQHFYQDVVGPYWPPERRHVEAGYRSLPFPVPELPTSPLAIRVSWTLSDLVGYVDTWSAVRGAERALGRSPVADFRRDLGAAWGDPSIRRAIAFPLSLRVGRLTG
jgi:SAM-dependent methyltransferase